METDRLKAIADYWEGIFHLSSEGHQYFYMSIDLNDMGGCSVIQEEVQKDLALAGFLVDITQIQIFENFSFASGQVLIDFVIKFPLY